jgi:hypothetical protein
MLVYVNIKIVFDCEGVASSIESKGEELD